MLLKYRSIVFFFLLESNSTILAAFATFFTEKTNACLPSNCWLRAHLCSEKNEKCQYDSPVGISFIQVAKFID